MEHLTALTSPIPFSGEDWFDSLEDAIRFRVRAFIEALVAEEEQAAVVVADRSGYPHGSSSPVNRLRSQRAHAIG